jgi:hypothetical protein
MKRENWYLILGLCVAVSTLCGLFLLLAARTTVVVVAAGKSIALAEAPVIVKVLLVLAVLISGALLAAPLLQAQPKSLH